MKKSQIKWYNEVIKKVNITQTGKREINFNFIKSINYLFIF